MDLEKCPGCGATFPHEDGPIHRYMLSSPACWKAYCAVLTREYNNSALMPVHRLSVDAYAMQHPGHPPRQSIHSIGLHLIRLYLLLEHGLAPELSNQAMLAAGRIKQTFTWLDPPSFLGDVTVRDVLPAREAPVHEAMIRRWAHSAWMAWKPHHPQTREWVAQSGMGFEL